MIYTRTTSHTDFITEMSIEIDKERLKDIGGKTVYNLSQEEVDEIFEARRKDCFLKDADDMIYECSSYRDDYTVEDITRVANDALENYLYDYTSHDAAWKEAIEAYDYYVIEDRF